jgi:hypothetical protein
LNRNVSTAEADWAHKFNRLITIDHNWRFIYYVSIALIGGTLALAAFTFPETVYIRSIEVDSETEPTLGEKRGLTTTESNEIPIKKTYLQKLRVFTGTYTEESFWRLFIRPFALILLPPVLWSSLVQSVTIGFIVAVTSNVASAFATTYNMKPYETGLCFIAAIIGALIGVFCGGSLGDKTADFFTKRNHGIREPEMRLPAMVFSLITTPLSLILYGVGIQNKLHWICPTVGLALRTFIKCFFHFSCARTFGQSLTDTGGARLLTSVVVNFSVVQGTNVALVYTIDAYRPIAGEVTLTTMAFKCKCPAVILVFCDLFNMFSAAFGFLLSFYTNPWIEKIGYLNAYGSMAGISVAVLLCWIPLYIWGKRIRLATWHWGITSYVHWDEDREVGE